MCKKSLGVIANSYRFLYTYNYDDIAMQLYSYYVFRVAIAIYNILGFMHNLL